MTVPVPEQVACHPVAAAALEASIKGTDAALRVDGSVMAPHVHFLLEDEEQPYGGCIHSRPYYRGRDAAEAITRLGLLPSALPATRILVVWEHNDLHVALETPRAHEFPFAVMSVEATVSTQTIIGRAFDLTLGRKDRTTGLPPATPHWGNPRVQTRYRLPSPINALIDLWKEFRLDEATTTMDTLDAEGYRIALAAR